MIDKKEEWLKEASYKLALLTEFEEHFLVPDGKTLNAFLKRPTLILKMMYKDVPDMGQEALDSYEDFEKNRKYTYQLIEEDVKKLEESYSKGLTPNEAAIDMIKWCDTPEEAGRYIASAHPDMFSTLFIMGIFIGILVTAFYLYGTVKEKVAVRDASEHLLTVYKNAEEFNEKNNTNLNNEKAIKSGIVPKEMKIEENKITNAWEGAVEIESTPSFFKLTYAHVPTLNSCVEFLEKQKNTGWDSVVVGNQKFENYSKITKLEVLKACDLENDHVDMIFEKIFEKK